MGHHTLEMRTNGTWYDIRNTYHLREKEGRRKRALKESVIKWEKLDP